MRVQGGTYKWKKAAEKQLCVLDIKGAAGIVYGYRGAAGNSGILTI